MIVTFWGVRGSIPVPGPGTLRYGGNTACVSITIDRRVLIIDAGTGIYALGNALAGTGHEFFLLFTHPHADHLQGFPFFLPLYRPEERIHFIDYEHEHRSFCPVDLFDGVHVPMDRSAVVARWDRCQEDCGAYLAQAGFQVSTIKLNHPGGSLGYRVSDGNHSIVHITDNELRAHTPGATPFETFVEFCRGVDVLSHDAQWTDTEAISRRGWGHSSLPDVCDLAVAAGVRRLILFHHDPARSDDQVDALQDLARQRLAQNGIQCDAAHEGMKIEF
jgi:phosphoribosyl 1,2-cyclic phosphodiesterase